MRSYGNCGKPGSNETHLPLPVAKPIEYGRKPVTGNQPYVFLEKPSNGKKPT